MAALETWITAVSSVAFLVFLEVTVLYKRFSSYRYMNLPFLSSPPCPQIPKLGESILAEVTSGKKIFSGSLLIHEQQYWANGSLLAVSFFFWNLRFMRIKYLLRAPAGVHCVMMWKASHWRHIKQRWDYPHFQRFHHKDTSHSSDNLWGYFE